MSTFKEALLLAKSNKLPIVIQNLIDNGIIQECETIDGVHYISFAFQLKNTLFYNYKNGMCFDFINVDHVDVIYTGGFAVNDKGNILKGIIYPYYSNIKTENQCYLFGVDNNLLPYVKGTPQIINKSDKLKIKDFFVGTSFKAYNLVTDYSNVWTLFAKGKELYSNTFVICDEKGNLYEPNDSNDLTYYGHVKTEYSNEYKFTKKYPGVYVNSSHAIPVSYVENKLDDYSISSSIAAKIFCTTENNKSRIKSANIAKEGMDDIGKSIKIAGAQIRTGASNIANALEVSPNIHYF